MKAKYKIGEMVILKTKGIDVRIKAINVRIKAINDNKGSPVYDLEPIYPTMHCNFPERWLKKNKNAKVNDE